MPPLSEQDRWPAQLGGPFGFLFARGFRVIAGSEYRLGEWTLLPNDFAGLHLKGDAAAQRVEAAVVRLDQGRLPERWLIPRMPQVMLGLREVAELLAPELLRGLAALPPLRNQSDRLPHLMFWAHVLQAIATPLLNRDEEWFERTAHQLSARRPEDRVWARGRSHPPR